MLKIRSLLNTRLLIPATLSLVVFSGVHAADEMVRVPQADLGIKINGEYQRVNEYVVPKEHIIGDGTIAYEGPGIESRKVAFRLYLDERSVLDIFGKKTSEPVLHLVGRGDDYHSMAGWGMDILKVGNSLGSGGLGVYENDKMRMVGPARQLSVKILDSNPAIAEFMVTHDGLSGDSGEFGLQTRYSMSATSRLLNVQAKSSGNAPPIAAGLVKHPGTELIESTNEGDSNWAYLATYGVQTLNDDELGLALFYPLREVSKSVDDGSTIGVVFNTEQAIHYKVAAAWVEEPGGIKDIDAFRAYLEDVLSKLEDH